MFRNLLIAITAALVTTQAMSAEPADDAQISRAITDIAAGADRGDWERVRNVFANTVETDYTSLWGGKSVSQSADELVKTWSGFLPGFDITHHMVTNHTVKSVVGNKAWAEADFIATHRIDQDFWTLGGRYSYELVKSDGRWLVSALTMTSLWETGDRGLVGRAADRMTKAKKITKQAHPTRNKDKSKRKRAF
ncbi:MAG: nuclear transport factor 2 family protein [Cohaesibacter sp.]|nr:nuclear transport factor 2 family protein [Cohaesibacter sp.]